MKDIIWTLIIVWLIYKLVEVFQSFSKRPPAKSRNFTTQNPEPNKTNVSRDRHLQQEGEYVDFEELK